MIYFLACIISFLFVCLADKTLKRKYIFVSIIILSLLSGFRGENVGIDTPNYYEMFNSILLNNPVYINEKFFVKLCSFLYLFLKKEVFLFVVYSFIINFFIILRFWDFRKNISLEIIFIIYLIVYFPMSLNIMRQFISVSLVFYGTRFLEKRNLFFYIIFVLCGMIFHISSLFGLGFIPIYFWINSNNKKIKKKVLKIGFLLVIPAFFLGVKVFSNYQHYFDLQNSNIGFMIFVKIGLVISYIICTDNFSNYRDKYAKYLSYVYLIGLLFSLLGYFISFSERIGLYFLIFECIYVAYICKNAKNRSIYEVLYFMIFMYIFIIGIVGNGQGVFPYYPFWENVIYFQ